MLKHNFCKDKASYQWGENGTCFSYPQFDSNARREARLNALEEGKAIEVNKGSLIAEELYAAPKQPTGTSAAEQDKSELGASSEMFDIKKYYNDQQLVFGWASVAKDKDGNRPIEWQGDEIEMYEMEPAVYDFVLDQGITKEMHRVEKAKGQVIESVIFTKEKMAAMGIPEGTVPEGWWVGFKLDNKETFQKVKSGEYKMFSIEGTGTRSPIGGTDG